MTRSGTTRRFPTGCVVSPHHLASSAGAVVLATGGNAVDAAVATNLVLSVVTPYHCGPGGDLFALVWDGAVHAYRGAGRAPAAATRDAVAAAAGAGRMPLRGALTVTVPGAVRGWFELLERFGTRSFGDLAVAAVGYARDGFVPSTQGGERFAAARAEHVGDDWRGVYGDAAAGRPLRQPGLARTLETLAAEGPGAFYRGAIGAAVAAHVRARGGLLDAADLAAHTGAWVTPLRGRFGDLEVVEHPPPTQGVTALQALAIVDGMWPLPLDPAVAEHLLVEAAKVALADRDAAVTDPDAMPVAAHDMLTAHHVTHLRDRIDPGRAGEVRGVGVGAGDTAYVCSADAAGMACSLIQSNYHGFGSGLTVPGWGVNLHNRGASFRLDPDDVNVVAPRKLPRHTLIPAMALHGGRPALVFGTMGGDGQAQTHLQLLVRLRRAGRSFPDALQATVAAPRWVVLPGEGSVAVESRFDAAVVRGLAVRGHRLARLGPYEDVMGHAQAVAFTGDGYAAAADPRTEGAAAGH